MPQFLAKAAIAPPGRHRCRLERIEPRESKYGRRVSDAWAWVFQVVSGQYAGRELVRITGTDLRVGTSFGELAEALLGRPIQVGESVDLDSCVGSEFEVFAVPGDDGNGAVVAKITPVTKE
jgi:hypothetical protein